MIKQEFEVRLTIEALDAPKSGPLRIAKTVSLEVIPRIGEQMQLCSAYYDAWTQMRVRNIIHSLLKAEDGTQITLEFKASQSSLQLLIQDDKWEDET